MSQIALVVGLLSAHTDDYYEAVAIQEQTYLDEVEGKPSR